MILSTASSSMMRYSLAVLWLLYCPVIVQSGNACILFIDGGAKCIGAGGLPYTNYTLYYEAPDLSLATISTGDEDDPLQEGVEKGPRSVHDISIVMFQKDSPSEITNLQNRRVREILSAKYGSVAFATAEDDSTVHICFQAYSASRGAPQLLSIDIYADSIAKPIPRMTPEEERILISQTGVVDTELTKMLKRIDEIWVAARKGKAIQADFYQLSVDLDNAIKYWPMGRMVILAVAAFLQVRYVVRYMKSKHIV